MYGHLHTCTEKSQTGYVVSTGSGRTLQQAPKIPESAEIMKNQATEPIILHLLLPYLFLVNVTEETEYTFHVNKISGS